MTVHDVSLDTVTEVFGTHRRLVVGGAVVTVFAAFLPWVTVGVGGTTAGSANGIELFENVGPLFNGVVTSILALVAVAACFQREWTPTTQRVVAALGGGILGIGLVVVTSPETAFGWSGSANLWNDAISTGVGLYLTVGGGGAIGAGGYLAFRDRADSIGTDEVGGAGSSEDRIGSDAFRR